MADMDSFWQGAFQLIDKAASLAPGEHSHLILGVVVIAFAGLLAAGAKKVPAGVFRAAWWGVVVLALAAGIMALVRSASGSGSDNWQPQELAADERTHTVTVGTGKYAAIADFPVTNRRTQVSPMGGCMVTLTMQLGPRERPIQGTFVEVNRSAKHGNADNLKINLIDVHPSGSHGSLRKHFKICGTAEELEVADRLVNVTFKFRVHTCAESACP